MQNPMQSAWQASNKPGAVRTLGSKALQIATPVGAAEVSNRLAGRSDDERKSADIVALGTQMGFGGFGALRRQYQLRGHNKALGDAQVDLQSSLTKAGIKGPKDVLPEQGAHDTRVKALDDLGIKYSPEYAAALAKPPQSRTPQEHQMILASGKALGHDPMNHLSDVNAAAASEAALKTKMAPIEQSKSHVDSSQQALDAAKAAQIPGAERAGHRNTLIAAGTGVASTPALNTIQAGSNALGSDPTDPNEKSWAGAPYRGVRDTAATVASNVLGPPKADTGLPWDKIALGGGAAALLAALLYKVMGKDRAEEDDSEEEG